MNREYVQQLLERIKKTPAYHVEMNVWLERSGQQMPPGAYRSPPVTEIAEHPEYYECGTIGCCAGHTVLIDIEKTRQAIKQVRNSEAVTFSSVAAHLLNIDHDTRRYLFDMDMWPSEYTEDGDKNGLVAILERALEENSFDFLFE